MSYLQFHGMFILPVLLGLLFLTRHRLRKAHAICILGVCIAAVIFTLPWDHHAVSRGIWEFDETKVWFRFWKLPIEEIAFFVLETVGVCLLAILFLPHSRKS